MRKKDKKIGENMNLDLKELAWRNFVETGEIGAYMFYKKICEEDDGRTKGSGDSATSD